MNHSASEEGLMGLIQMLSPAKQRQLMEITQALAEPIQADINWTAGLVTAELPTNSPLGFNSIMRRIQKSFSVSL